MMRLAAYLSPCTPRRPAVAATLFAVLLLLSATGCDQGGGSDARPPPPPVRLSATQTSSSIILAWDTNAPERTDGYNVYRATGRTPPIDGKPINSDTPVNGQTFSDDTVTEGAVYAYVVTAVGEGGESDPSSMLEVRFYPDPPSRP